MKIALVAAALSLFPLAATAAEIDPRALDLTGSPQALEIRAAMNARLQARGLRAPAGTLRSTPLNGMTVSDHGRITVVRDATGAHWGDGVAIGDLFNGLSATMDAYYAAHPDADPEFVMVVQDWLNTAFLGAFYNPVANDTTGIGYRNSGPDVFDNDPSSALQGYIWMNGVQFFTEVPGHELFTRILWGQEFAHRWGMFVHFNDGGVDSGALLGRQEAHWSWYADSDWSWIEGNDWRNNLDGTFTTDVSTFDAVTHYNPLDLYLMGLLGTADVPAFTLLVPNQQGDAAAPPDAWKSTTHTIGATPKTVTVQDVIAVEGPRVPDYHSSPKNHHVAVLYALRKGDRIDPVKIEAMESVLDKMLASWNADVGGRATVDFGPQAAPQLAPAVSLVAPDMSLQHRPARFDASNAVDPAGKPLHWFWRFDDGAKTKFVEGPPIVEHVFGNEGDKVIEVSVRNDDGAETIVTHPLHVNAAGKYSCAVGGASGRAPLSVIALGFALAMIARVRRRQP